MFSNHPVADDSTESRLVPTPLSTPNPTLSPPADELPPDVPTDSPDAAAVAAAQEPHRLGMLWGNVILLTSFHLLAVAAVLYMVFVHFSWLTLGLGFVWLWLCGFAITGGYHRLFAHPTYRCAWPIKLFHLMFGAAAVQNTALAWASDHRVHHKFVDREADPYCIKKGFQWAHIGWVYHESPVPHDYSNVKDLMNDPWLRWQERHYISLALGVGVLAPMLIGMLWGDPIGCLLTVGFLRLVILYHMTFSINSVAHILGHQPYSIDNTARDSVFTSLVTLGEGYHNFHHRFQIDYRNGVRFYHFDPTKWALAGLSWCGLAWNLRRTPPDEVRRVRAEVVQQKAVRAEEKKRGSPPRHRDTEDEGVIRRETEKHGGQGK